MGLPTIDALCTQRCSFTYGCIDLDSTAILLLLHKHLLKQHVIMHPVVFAYAALTSPMEYCDLDLASVRNAHGT